MNRKAENPTPKPAARKKAGKPVEEVPQAPSRKGAAPRRPARKAEGAPGADNPVAGALSGKRGTRLTREMLAIELRRVRSLFHEIAERYLADTEGRIVALIGEVESARLPAASLDRLLGEVRALKVKPRKGRRKDLGRIESMVDSLRKTLDG